MNHIGSDLSEEARKRHDRIQANMLARFLVRHVSSKNKKSKTKCQQKRPVRLQHGLLKAGDGYPIRRCSRYRFIVADAQGGMLYDLKHRTKERLSA